MGRSVVNQVDDRLIGPIRGLSDQTVPPSRGDWWQDAPGLQVFFSKDLNGSGATSLLELYALADRLRTVQQSLKLYSGAKQRAYIQANLPILERAAQIQAADRQIRNARKAIDAIYENKHNGPRPEAGGAEPGLDADGQRRADALEKKADPLTQGGQEWPSKVRSPRRPRSRPRRTKTPVPRGRLALAHCASPGCSRA